MEKRVSVILLTTLTMAVFVLSNGVDVKDKDGKIFVDEVDRRLQLLNRPAVKSITVCHYNYFLTATIFYFIFCL